MILVDTSIWIDHLRARDELLVTLLNSSQIAVHPLIIGELACGNLQNRARLLTLLKNLPTVQPAQHEEVLSFIEQNRLMGRGIGFIDAHLLAALALSQCTFLWTRDKRLALLAEELGLLFKEKQALWRNKQDETGMH